MHNFIIICEFTLELQSGNPLTSVTLTFDHWTWYFAWTSLLSLVTTDRQTNWTIHRAAWSQLEGDMAWCWRPRLSNVDIKYKVIHYEFCQTIAKRPDKEYFNQHMCWNTIIGKFSESRQYNLSIILVSLNLCMIINHKIYWRITNSWIFNYYQMTLHENGNESDLIVQLFYFYYTDTAFFWGYLTK